MNAPVVETLPFDAFSRAEAAWNDLVAASATPYPFLLHPWLVTWWRHFGAEQEFRAIVVREGPVWLAAAPLALRRVRTLGSGATVAEIVGTGPVPTRGMGLTDKADLPLRAGAERALEPLAQALRDQLEAVDVIRLKGLDEASPTAAALARSATRGASLFSLPRSVSPFLSLPPSWDDYLATRSPKTRKYLRRCRRRLEDIGEVAIDAAPPGADPGPWLREALEIDAASWTATRGTNLYRDIRLREFFLDLLPQLARAGWLDLRLLRVGGTAWAYELCFDVGGRVYSYNGGYRTEHAELSPGTVLTAAVIEAACARGRSEYDMLRGGEAYKASWSREERHEREVVLRADRVRARWHALAGVRAPNRLRRIRWLVELDDRLTGLRSRRKGSGLDN